MTYSDIEVFTIGFTKTTAEHFFDRLVSSGVKRVIDVRLNNASQLAGFAKGRDIGYFLESIGEIDYVHEPLLAPTVEILSAYKKDKRPWEEYEEKFLDLMEMRKIDQKLSPELFHQGCLLCSEDRPHFCHRRLVVEFLNERWDTAVMTIHHL